MDSPDQLEEYSSETLRDDASIEILSEAGESYSKELEWSMLSAGRSLAGSSVSLMDFQKLSIHSKMATIVHHDGAQFIERRNSDLPYSAEFRLGDEMWKLSGDERLLTCGSRYIASVCIDGEVELQNAVDFNEAIHLLLKHLKVERVFVDVLLEECNKAKDVVKMHLEKLAEGSEEGDVWGLFKLWKLLEDHDSVLSSNIMYSIEDCPDVSNEMIAAINCFVAKGLQLYSRIEILDPANTSQRPIELLENAIHEAVRIRRNQIAAICPPIMKEKLMELNSKQILGITKGDMDLLNDLSTLDQSMIGTALPKLVNKLLTKVQQIDDDQQSALSSRMLFFVCKSLQETANELKVEVHYNDEQGWNIMESQKEFRSPYDQCLKRQLQMLVKLANHFEPGGPFLKNNFPYEFQLFQNVDSIPEEVRIWLCLLDDSMKDWTEADVDQMQMFSCLFKSYVSLIGSERFRSGTLEGLRKVTQDSLRSLAEMRRASSQERVTADSSLPEYEDTISNCLRSVPVEYFKDDSEIIYTTLQQIATHVKMPSDKSTALPKVFGDLLTDMTDFQFVWFVRLPSSDERDLLLRTQFIVPVDNRWKDTESQCFQVTDEKGFINVYRALHRGNEIPKHYQLIVIRVLLQQVEKLATKQAWQGGNHLSRMDQLEAMATLIISIRKSMLYFREQPDSASFDDFQQNMIKPVIIAVEQSSSLEDFRNRVGLIRNLRTRTVLNLNTPDVEEAWKIIGLQTSKDQSLKDNLKHAFRRYSTTFKQRILQNNTASRKDRIQNICKTLSISNSLKRYPIWEAQFTQTTLPDCLASLSAVWSLIVSKDVSSLESLVKPTCLQTCYVLQYLLMEVEHGFNLNQFIELSATQGKMLVLGLIAAFFAVFGYNVVIVCYNSSLFRRNATDILKLFELFAVESKISFGTIEDLARQQSEMIYHRYAKYIHQCLDIPFCDKSLNQTHNSSKAAKSIVIIDETDIFFLKGHCDYLTRFVKPIIPGLATVQEQIYSSDRKFTVQEIKKFIEMSDLPQMAELRAFLDKPKSYELLRGSDLQKIQYTNKTLFLAHLDTMLQNNELPGGCYRLTSEGKLKAHHLNDNNILSYEATAEYFQLKQSNFQQIVGNQTNYGFLQGLIVPFPYTNLLSGLSIGFQSTCSSYQYKRNLGNPYWSWTKSLTWPRDPCPTKFDPKQDFLCVKSELDWMISIMTAIHTAIERHDSVLVFFNSEVELHRFQKEFASQLKRLKVTAIETSSNGKGSCEGEPLLDEVCILLIDEVDSVAEERDTHVIQTFCSMNVNEENLIRKQAERKHSNGSYELILCIPQVCQEFSAAVEAGSYDLLACLRNRYMEQLKTDFAHFRFYFRTVEKLCAAVNI